MAQRKRKRRINPVLQLCHDGKSTMSLGCLNCRTKPTCGGLYVHAAMYSCRALCCNKPDECQSVCTRRGASYINHLQEVQGLSLEGLSKLPAVKTPPLHSLVPMIYSRSRRTAVLRSQAVAIPLVAVIDRRQGSLKFPDRAALAAGFLFEPTAQIVISGVDVDQSLERYWSKARTAGIVEAIASLGPALVTTPNFSLFVDVPREDNLHNMKRIAICWHELSEAGIPTALHLNGRTDADWKNWISFLQEHGEIDAIAIEFATGLRNPARGLWHVEQLENLRRNVDRDLALVVRGNRYSARLKLSFPRLIQIDTSIYMKSMKRQLSYKDGAQHKWRRTMTLTDQPLDDLFQTNVNTVRGIPT
jgi:hypothetical protein